MLFPVAPPATDSSSVHDHSGHHVSRGVFALYEVEVLAAKSGEGLAGPPPGLLETHRRVLEDLGGRYMEIVGTDTATTLVHFARSEHATQLVLGASRKSRAAELFGGSTESLGDLALTGCEVIGHIVAYRCGHHLNAELARRLLEQIVVADQRFETVAQRRCA